MATQMTAATASVDLISERVFGRASWATNLFESNDTEDFAPVFFPAGQFMPANDLGPVDAGAGVNWIKAGLSEIGKLKADWDGYGADPIHKTTIERMESLLCTSLPENHVRGSIVPGADGSLQAEWHLDRVELGLVVEPDGKIATWVKPRGSDSETEAFGVEASSLFKAVAATALV